MARAGMHVDEAIAGVGIPSGVAARRIVEIISADGSYRAVHVGPDRIQFARSFRPTWATVTAWCTLPIALIGVVFFFVKSTELCTATMEEDHRGTRVRFSGKLDRDVLARLRAAFTDPAAAKVGAAAASAVGAPVAQTYATIGAVDGQQPPSGPAVAPVAPLVAPPAPVANGSSAAPPAMHGSPQPPVAPPAPTPAFTPPAPAPPTAPDAGGSTPDAGRRSAWWGGPAGVEPRPAVPVDTVVLDDGRALDLSKVVLIGRDPAPAPSDNGVALLAIDDPNRSVSKTHLAVGADSAGVWVVDRDSTNGTRLVDAGGVESELLPGERVQVPEGASVCFGARRLTVVGAHGASRVSGGAT